MALVINTNIASLAAQRNLAETQDTSKTAMERLSSGMRINSAKDDAAGLAVASRMTSQVQGMNVAMRNAADGISLTQTAEGALQEVTNNLHRMRELAVQAANSSLSDSDRQALQLEVTQLSAEIDRVANNAKFNGITLLDGSYTSKSFHVGADKDQTVTMSSIKDTNVNAIGSSTKELTGDHAGLVDTASTLTGGAVTVDVVDFNGNTIGSQQSVTVATTSEADDIATLLNGVDAAYGITAVATNSVVLDNIQTALDADTSLGAFSFSLNGVSVSGTHSSATDFSAIKDAINAVSGQTNVSAAFTGTALTSLTLTSTAGQNINITSFDTATNTDTVDLTGTNGAAAVVLSEGGTAALYVRGEVTVTSSKGTATITDSTGEVAASGGDATTLSAIDTINIGTSSTTANNAIAVIDGAIAMVADARADLGAMQSRFESIISSLRVSAESASAARSRIMDADFAAETAALTKNQILSQAGISVLAQANAQPQQVLALLQ